MPARAPIFWAALAFAIGIWIGKYAWRPPTWWVVSACSLTLAALYFRKCNGAFSSVLALGTFVLCGALAIQTSGNNVGEIWLGNGEAIQVTAHVVSDGSVRNEGDAGLYQQVDLETENIESETRTVPSPAGIRLNIYAKDTSSEGTGPDSSRNVSSRAMQPLTYGQRIRFSGVLSTPRNFRNPGAFDYAGYLHDEGIEATSSIKYSEIEFLRGFSGSRLNYYLGRVRNSILDHIHQLWPEQDAALLDAMLLGEKSFVERPDRVDFQRSGTYHMLIIAGLHVGIVAAFLLWLFRRVGLGAFTRSLLTIPFILAYAALTREGSPVWRATLMIAVYLVTRFLYRRRAVLNALGAAALVLLVANPNVLLGASFQMSFLCVALIAGIAVPFLERTIAPYATGLRNLDALAWDRSLPPNVAQFRLDLRMILGRISFAKGRSWVRRTLLLVFRMGFTAAELAVISAVMQFGMALPMAFYFHRATVVATPANLLAVPFLQLVIPAALLSISTSYFWFSLAKIPAAIASCALHAITGTVHWLGGLHIADLRLPTPSVAVIDCSGICILVSILVFRRHRTAYAGIALLTASAVCVWVVSPREHVHAHALELTAIDVGQGESLLLVFPDRHKLLVDGGGLPFWAHSQMDIGEDVVSPYLWARGISGLDAIVLTHAHADHMGGLPAVIANFHPRELWLPQGIRDEEIQPLLKKAERFNVKIVHHKAGDLFDYGGAQIRVLAPDPDFPIRVAHRNDESLVMKISYGQTSALLEADAERGTERLVANEHPEADVLKVAHHGSATSSEPELLAAVHPKFAVISAGVRNVYHHPRPEVLQRLQQSSVMTYRTDIDGATTFYLDGARVTTELPMLH